MAATHDLETLSAYRETILEVGRGPEPLRLDLRRPVPADAADLLRGVGLARTFAVLTATNPRGEEPDDAPAAGERRAREAANHARTFRLAEELASRGVTVVPVLASAASADTCEPCLAFESALDEATSLARRYEQLGFFWFDGSRFWLCGGLVQAAPRPLP